MNNPFAQVETYFEMTCELPKSAADNADLYFENIAVSVATFEVDEAKAIWKLIVLFAEEPENCEIERRLSLLGFDKLQFSIDKKLAKDWVCVIAEDFPPLRIGRFYVHGSHIREEIPVSFIGLQIDAGAAFGSGEHSTTSGCLAALEFLYKSTIAKKLTAQKLIMDMGTGSGILAIAAAKIFHKAKVEAYDLDKISVRVASENSHINSVHNTVKTKHSNGYLHKEIVRKNNCYDIVLANILARPLCQMARHAANSLSENGMLILSGLLIEQENMVISAHHLQNLTLVKRFRNNGWSTLVLTKKCI